MLDPLLSVNSFVALDTRGRALSLSRTNFSLAFLSEDAQHDLEYRAVDKSCRWTMEPMGSYCFKCSLVYCVLQCAQLSSLATRKPKKAGSALPWVMQSLDHLYI